MSTDVRKKLWGQRKITTKSVFISYISSYTCICGDHSHRCGYNLPPCDNGGGGETRLPLRSGACMRAVHPTHGRPLKGNSQERMPFDHTRESASPLGVPMPAAVRTGAATGESSTAGGARSFGFIRPGTRSAVRRPFSSDLR